jgi:hypothetical protein
VQVPLSQAATAVAPRASRSSCPTAACAPERPTELASADPVSQTVEWRLDLPARLAVTGAGPGGRVHFSGAAPPRPVAIDAAPAPAAVLRRGELNAVYVAQGDGFALRAVRLGACGADGIDVLAGPAGR